MISDGNRFGLLLRATNNIEKLSCNSLLATLIILQRKVVQQFVCIVGSNLHSDNAGSMLTSQAIKHPAPLYNLKQDRP